MNREQFNREIRPLWEIYRNDNNWVGNWQPSWNDDNVMQEFVGAAYRLYKATSSNELKLVLLGGTSIRKNKHLICNFGITGVSGIQDNETEQIAGEEQRLRTMGQSRPNAPELRVPVYAVGSILSEEKWTPLLNDALIIGSAVAGHKFQLALEPGYHHSWTDSERYAKAVSQPEVENKIDDLHRVKGIVNVFNQHVRHSPNDAISPANAKARSEIRQEYHQKASAFHHGAGKVYYKEAWKHFLNSNLHLLWDRNLGIPRVLARELIGLFVFGYRPEFNNMTLGFSKRANAPHPFFSDYVRELRKLGMERENRVMIMKRLSTCLFDDDMALGFPEDRLWKPNVAAIRKNFEGGGHVPRPHVL